MKIFIGFVLSTLLIACKNEPGKLKYFEGYVDYKVETIVTRKSEVTKRYVHSIGNSMRCYFKNGSYMREYFDSNNISTSKHLYQASTGRFVYMIRNMRYNYFQQLDENGGLPNIKDWKIIDSTLSKMVLSRICTGYTISYKTVGADLSNNLATYYHTNTLPFDYSHFKNSKNVFYHYVSNKFPSVALCFVEESVGNIKITSTATQIVATSLSDTLFTIPADKPLIHN